MASARRSSADGDLVDHGALLSLPELGAVPLRRAARPPRRPRCGACPRTPHRGWPSPTTSRSAGVPRRSFCSPFLRPNTPPTYGREASTPMQLVRLAVSPRPRRCRRRRHRPRRRRRLRPRPPRPRRLLALDGLFALGGRFDLDDLEAGGDDGLLGVDRRGDALGQRDVADVLGATDLEVGDVDGEAGRDVARLGRGWRGW